MASLRGPHPLTGESDLRVEQINRPGAPRRPGSGSASGASATLSSNNNSSTGLSAGPVFADQLSALAIPSPPHASSLADISPALAAQLGIRAANMIGPSASYPDGGYTHSSSASGPPVPQMEYNDFMRFISTDPGTGQAPSPQHILEAAQAAAIYYPGGESPATLDPTWSSNGSFPSPLSIDLSYRSGAGSADGSGYGFIAHPEILSPEAIYDNEHFPQQNPSTATPSIPSPGSSGVMPHQTQYNTVPVPTSSVSPIPPADPNKTHFSVNRYRDQFREQQKQPTPTSTLVEPTRSSSTFSVSKFREGLTSFPHPKDMENIPPRQTAGRMSLTSTATTATTATTSSTTSSHANHQHQRQPSHQLQQHKAHNQYGQSGSSQGVAAGPQVPHVKVPTAPAVGTRRPKVSTGAPKPYARPTASATHPTGSTSTATTTTGTPLRAATAATTTTTAGRGVGPERTPGYRSTSALTANGAVASTSTKVEVSTTAAALAAANASIIAAGRIGSSGLKPRNGACSNCKRLKMRCVPVAPNQCKRCRDSGKECLFEGRKQGTPGRSVVNKKAELEARIREKDAVIETLLKQLHNPNLLTPLGVSTQRLAPSVSSVSHEERVNKDILAWIEKAQASVRAQNLARGEDQAMYRRDTSAYLDQESSGEDSDSGSYSEDDDNMDGNGFDGEGLSPQDPESPSSRRPGKKRTGSNSPKLHSLPEKSAPIGLLADLSINDLPRRPRSHSGRSGDQLSSGGDLATNGEDDDVRGVADPEYYRPGPATNPNLRRIIIERQMAPEILTSGLITSDEVEKLFGIFFDKLNVFVSILDPVIHTPATIFGRCPFLFTVICAISSRYYTDRPDLYHVAMHFAKTAAASTLIDGWKSVELCQAYILLAVYPLQARRWEEDRTWLYLGLAIRMATDLNLHQPTTTKIINEQHEREILNRTRTWLICFNLDRSSSAQLGKPTTIREDWIIRNSKEWWKRSKHNFKMDIHLCTYTSLLRIMARFQEVAYSDPNSPTGIQTKLDYKNVTFSFDEELATYRAETAAKFAVHSDQNDPVCVYRAELMPFLVNYSRLVILSFGFQQAYQKGISPSDDVVIRCLDAASSVVKIMADSLAPKGFLRYAPDGHFVFAAFASAFLIKMLRLEFKSLLDDDQRQRVIQLVSRLIKVLSSPEVAIDDRHTPKLYAKFLTSLLNKYVICPDADKNGQDKGKGPAHNYVNGTTTVNGRLAVPMTNGRSPVNGHASTSNNGGRGGSLPQSQLQYTNGTSVPHPPIEIVPPKPGDTTYDHHPEHDTHPQQLYPPSSYPDMSAVNNGFTHTDIPLTQAPLGPHMFSPDSSTFHGNSPLTIDELISSSNGGGSTVQPDTETEFTMDYVTATAEDDMLAAMYAVTPTSNFWNHMMLPGFSWPAEDAQLPWEMQLDSDSMGVPPVIFGGAGNPI